MNPSWVIIVKLIKTILFSTLENPSKVLLVQPSSIWCKPIQIKTLIEISGNKVWLRWLWKFHYFKLVYWRVMVFNNNYDKMKLLNNPVKSNLLN